MRMRIGFWCSVLVVVLGCLFAALAFGEDVSGKWRAEFQTRDGTKRVNIFVFKVDGDKVTGTVAGRQDETTNQEWEVNQGCRLVYGGPAARHVYVRREDRR